MVSKDMERKTSSYNYFKGKILFKNRVIIITQKTLKILFSIKSSYLDGWIINGLLYFPIKEFKIHQMWTVHSPQGYQSIDKRCRS